MAQETIVIHPTRQHAEALQTPLVQRAVVIRLALGHADALRAGHGARAVSVRVAGRWDTNALNIRVP